LFNDCIDDDDDIDDEPLEDEVAIELLLLLILTLVRCLFVGGAILSPPSKSLLSELDASMD